MKTLSIDIETYSSVNLGKAGVYAYSEAPDFTVLLFGYSIDGGPVQVVDLTPPPSAVQMRFDAQAEDTLREIPPDVLSALTDPAVLKTAHNAAFERTCLAAYLGVPMPPEQWECTMVRCAEAGLPLSLKAAGNALGMARDRKKDAVGGRLIRYFCIPCKPTRRNHGRTRNLPEHDLDKWAQFIAYNRQDVVAEMALRDALPPIIPSEQRLWEIDQRINDRGVRTDAPLVNQAVIIGSARRAELIEEAQRLTGLENPNSRKQILAWINDETDLEQETFRKEDLPEILQKTDNLDVHRIIEIRQELGKTSTTKYGAMQRAVCADGRVRGLTAFYGAPRTGRWSGRLVQLQNLPRNNLEDLDSPRELIRSGNGGALELLYENPADILSQLVRTALIPADGSRFIVSDFSAIEARVLAWLAGEEWRLKVFRSGGKIYEESASKMFHVPVELIRKGNPEYALRQKGKISELALGYQGAQGALTQMGALKMGLEEEELPGLVGQWRNANTHITALWSRAEAAARHALTLPPGSRLHAGIAITDGAALKFFHDKAGLRIVLPSGRSLIYRNARIEYVPPKDEDAAWRKDKDNIVYDGTGTADEAKQRKTGTRGNVKRIPTYGGKIVENITQAVARDCLAEAMRTLDALGFRIVFHVHDEVILEERIGQSSAAEVAELMGLPIAWAPGLPLTADAYECTYYKKD